MNSIKHISAALRQLRKGVNLCAAVVALACIVQLTVFGFVHFTDIRFETLKSNEVNRPRVVNASVGDAPAGLRALAASAPTPAMIDEADHTPPAPVDINRVESTAGVVLEQISQSAAIVGIFGAISLAAFTLLGAIVAGGGAVPGVEKAVSACTWGLVLGMMTLPWQDIFTSMPFAGVFTSYGTMTAASDGAASGLTLILLFIGIPLVAVIGTSVVALNFSIGVERGIVAANAPDAIDQDMAATMQAMGSTRQIGAVRNDFRKAVGASEVATPSAGPAKPAKPEPQSRSSAPPPRRRAVLNQDEEEDWKRPI